MTVFLYEARFLWREKNENFILFINYRFHFLYRQMSKSVVNKRQNVKRQTFSVNFAFF